MTMNINNIKRDVKTPATDKKNKNANLSSAKTAKNDEFYTMLTDVEKEMKHYTAHFKDKVIYCNCDDARESKFFHYFSYQFEVLGLKQLIAVAYKEGGKGVYYEYNGDKNGNRVPDAEEIEVVELEGDGDFRSAESIDILMRADIVVTNPPFSLFREYVQQLVDHDKQFIIIGNVNAITYKETFKLIKDGKIWLGIQNGSKDYLKPDGTTQSFGNTCWFTNLSHKKRAENVILYKHYSPHEYPMYDNYFAFNVDFVKDIPINEELEMILTEEEYQQLIKSGQEFQLVKIIDEN